jgi:hypothetical protein
MCPVCAAWRAPAELSTERTPRQSRGEDPPTGDVAPDAEAERTPPELAHR